MGIKCDANMVGDREADVDFDIIPNANDTFTVKYIPPAAGKMTIKVLFTDKVRTHRWFQARDHFGCSDEYVFPHRKFHRAPSRLTSILHTTLPRLKQRVLGWLAQVGCTCTRARFCVLRLLD